MAIKVDPTQTIPTAKSKADEWIEWHKELKSNFGKKQANALFIKAWKLRGSNSITTNAMRTYFHGEGVDIDKSLLDAIVDKTVSVTDFMGDILNVGKYTGLAFLVILVGGVGLIVFNLAKSPAKAIGNTLKYAK